MTPEAPGDLAYRRPAHVAHVVDQPGDRRSVLLHLPSGRRVTLSATGTAVWQAVVAAGEAGVRAADLAPALAEQFGADPQQVADDVTQLLAQLADEDLVEPAGALPGTAAAAAPC